MPLLLQTLTRLNGALAWIVKAVLVVVVAVMTSAVLWQVLMRYVFNRPPSWSEELALLMFSWSMMLMLAVGVREGFHVRMDALLVMFSRPLQQAVLVLIDVSIVGFGVYLTWSGYDYVIDTSWATSAAIGYPVPYLYSAAPVCGALITVFGLEVLLKRLLVKERPGSESAGGAA